MTPTISSLLSRVGAASGPDRELDAFLRAAFFEDMGLCDFEAMCWHGECTSPGCGKPVGMFDERGSYPQRWEDDERLPRYTASIDAAIALVERVLPDANTIGVVKNPKGALGYVARNYVHSGHWMHDADAATTPLAILAALLSALEQKEST